MEVEGSGAVCCAKLVYIPTSVSGEFPSKVSVLKLTSIVGPTGVIDYRLKRRRISLPMSRTRCRTSPLPD